MSEIKILFGAGCPSGTTVHFTHHLNVNMDEEVAYDFVHEMMDYIQAQAILWGYRDES